MSGGSRRRETIARVSAADHELAAQVGALEVLRRARRALVLVPLVLAVALLAAALLARRSLSDALQAAARGEGNVLLHDAEQRLRAGGTPEEIVAQLAPSGLRCLVVYGREATVAAAAGTCAGEADLSRALREIRPEEVRDDGGRPRMARHLPPHPRGGPPPDFGPPGRPEGPRGHPGPPPTGGPPGPLLIEFEPVRTSALSGAAGRLLMVALACAATLAATAAGAGWLSAHAARLQDRLARGRHLASLGEMAAVMAHEIRNPLASMKGNAQLLVEQLPEPGPARSKAERLVSDAVRLERLTEDLLGLSGAASLQCADADPVAVLRGAVDDVAGAVDIQAAGAPAVFRLDADRMRQVLTNLLRNALQATDPPQPVTASVATEGGRLVYAVRDRGPGVPESERDRIFEPFHTTRLRGTGLGLAVARRIVEAHGGTIEASGHPEGGAVFRVALPPA
jgi:two-component system sensor histidine kinase HydH